MISVDGWIQSSWMHRVVYTNYNIGQIKQLIVREVPRMGLKERNFAHESGESGITDKRAADEALRHLSFLPRVGYLSSYPRIGYFSSLPRMGYLSSLPRVGYLRSS